MTNKSSLAFAALFTLAGVTVLAEQTFVRPAAGVRFVEQYRPADKTGDTRIIGSVIDIGQAPVGYARVQLRDLGNGTVVQESTANESGEYSFTVIEPGTYVVEALMLDGYVLALSNAGALMQYETLQTVVQLPGRWDASNRRMAMPQDVTSFFGMSAQNTMSAQTIGMAIEQSIQPQDSGEPVSPIEP